MIEAVLNICGYKAANLRDARGSVDRPTCSGGRSFSLVPNGETVTGELPCEFVGHHRRGFYRTVSP